MEEITYEQWLERGKEVYGDDFGDWKFTCVACGNVQSIKSVKERNPDLELNDIAAWITQECEGRHAKSVGCDWALYGLLKIHDRQVAMKKEKKTVIVPTFLFACEDPEPKIHKKKTHASKRKSKGIKKTLYAWMRDLP